MGEKTGIEWADHTFNPWWGCEKISPGCANCYAADLAARFGTEWGPKAPRRFFGEKHWNEPLAWNKAAEKAGVRRRVFCASMADVFEKRDDLDESRSNLFALIRKTPSLDWLLLTKRPENVRTLTPPSWWLHGFPENVWLGATVENQDQAEKRIPHLLATKARVKFLSCEPLLRPVYLKSFAPFCWEPMPAEVREHFKSVYPAGLPANSLNAVMSRARIDWVICGGESGKNARPMHPGWARSLRDQCAAALVPFFFKQWGEFGPREDVDFTRISNMQDTRDIERFRIVNLAGGHGFHGELAIYMERVGKKAAGSLLDGVEHKAFPLARGEA